MEQSNNETMTKYNINNKIDISIIIVSWNVKNLLQKCLESIIKHQGDLKLEIIVVDNVSSDGTAEMIKKHFPNVRFIANVNNLGFAKANNQGIKQSTGKYILILNPDTEILPKLSVGVSSPTDSALQKMYTFFVQQPNADIASCKHLNVDGTLQPSVRRFPTFWSQFFLLHKLHHLWPNLKTFRYYFASDFDYEKTQPVEQIPGSFLMIDRRVIDKIGMFDENFFIWFEDVDFCRRAVDAGFKIYYNPAAKIIHYGGQSFKQVLTLKKQKMFNKSLLYYFKKHHGWCPWFFLLKAHFNSLALAWLISLRRR